MTELLTLTVSSFRGQNVNDPPQDLLLRSHLPSESGWSPAGPWGIESPDTRNIDMDPGEGIRNRLGSAEVDDISNAGSASPKFGAAEVLIEGIEWQSPVTRSRIEVWLTSVSIWSNQSGSWAKLNAASGTQYNHAAAVTKGSFTQVGGHLIIGMDGDNPLQAYRNGAALDEHLMMTTTSPASTVDSDSNSGQKVLNVAATTLFSVFDRVTINSGGGGGGEESGFIDSIQSGISITLKDNLTFTHTAVQADEVIITNRWTEAFGGAQVAIEGDWDTGNYLTGAMHSRLLFGKGEGSMQFTAADEPFDRLAGGSKQSSGAIAAFAAAAPEYTNSLAQLGYIWTEQGLDVITGFTSDDELIRMEGRAAPMNHRCIVRTGNWIMYLTREKRIMAINAALEIDVGRRLKNNTDGPLDTINLTAAESKAFGFFDQDRAQVLFFVPTGSNTTNSDCFVLDVQQGEPAVGESESSYERKVAPLHWQIISGSTWFQAVYRVLGATYGALATGITYTMNSGTSDLGTLAIDAFWDLPDFHAGLPQISKQWMALFVNGLPTGDWDVTVSEFEDRDTGSSRSDWSYSQINEGQDVYGTGVFGTAKFGGDGILKADDDAYLYSRYFRFRVRNANAGETFRVTDFVLTYLIGAEERNA